MNNKNKSYFDDKIFDVDNKEHQVYKIMENIRATSAFVAILKHYGELSVPKEIFEELIDKEQVWPNDFITNNGSSMAIKYDPDSNSFSFKLEYLDEWDGNGEYTGHQCTRNMTDVGYVDYNSPYYRN